MNYLTESGLATFYAGLRTKFLTPDGSGANLTNIVKTVNGYAPNSNGNITIPGIGSDTSNRQAFSYTVDPSEWLSGVNGEYWTDYVDAVQIGVSSLSLVNLVVVSDVLNEDTGLNPQNGYAFGMQCQRESTDLSNPYPNRVRFYYGKGAANAPGNSLTFTGYVVADDGTMGGTNIGYYVNGADSGHPVGSIYQSIYNVSPALLFGGTWTRIAGRFLLGATEDADVSGDASAVASDSNTTGGYKNAIVVSHTHNAGTIGGAASQYMGYNRGAVSDAGITERAVASGASGNYKAPVVNNANVNYAGWSATASAGVSGEGRNVPPYFAVYTWQRVA